MPLLQDISAHTAACDNGMAYFGIVIAVLSDISSEKSFWEATMAGKQPESLEDLRIRIMAQIAQLSTLLGEMPDDDKTVRSARNAFLQLSTLIGRALDINLQ